MANRYYTLMIVPEKTARVRKLTVPAWLLRGSAVGLAFLFMVAFVMVLNYWYVMNQISESKQLRIENRRLRQQVQVFKNKMTTVENTLDRVKTFATRLKVITNIEDRGGLLQALQNGKIPDAATNVVAFPPNKPASAAGSTAIATAPEESAPQAQPTTEGEAAAPGLTQAPSLVMPPLAGSSLSEDTEDLQLSREYEELDLRSTELNREALFVEQVLQDQYELLADQKAFLAALPVIKPAIGYFTSGFGVRKSPYGDRVKMHEGLDIANRPGTPIKASADGVVQFADAKSGYGQTLILNHGYGLETWYAHTKKLLVTKGQKVKRGETVALLGNSGRSTGPHIHYEVRVNGTPVDPWGYILEN